MKCAADFRQTARESLRGNWVIAVLTGFVASLIGAEIVASGGGGNGGSSNAGNGAELQQIFQNDIWVRVMPFIIVAGFSLMTWGLVVLVVSGAGKLGYARFNLNLIDKREAKFMDLFSQFDRLWTGFCMNFFMGLYIFFWSLLFVIPGIVKSYSYAMTPYILSENPHMTANEAITESRRIMNGNKWRLFCLGFSFIGWSLLCTLPTAFASVFFASRVIFLDADIISMLGVIPIVILSMAGYLFLRPYMETAYAAFYRDISRRKDFEVIEENIFEA